MPPPPPPAPAPPPPPPVNSAGPPPSVAPKDLLKSIHKGAKLKKVVTNDRSGPFVEGPKPAPTTSGGGKSPSMSRGGFGSGDTGSGPQLGGLFAGGMPKLKPSGANALSNQIPPSQNTQSGAASNIGLTAALRARASSGENVNTAAYKPSNIPPPTAPRKENNPILIPPTRNNISVEPPLFSPRSNSFSGPPVVPSRPVDQIPSFQISDSIPPRPTTVSAGAPPVAPRNLPSTMNKPSSMFNSSSSKGNSPRASISNITGSSNGSLNQNSMSHNTSTTIQDGRWLFQSDIPLPRQWPSGDPAPGGSSAAGPAKARPPPPPPSRSAATANKRPPPPPPGGSKFFHN